jgi:hypothetical protein
MEGDEVWVVETHRGHGESARVHGVYVSREAAWDALKELPNMTVYVDDDGRLQGRPKNESWQNPNRLWAWGHPMRMQARKSATAQAE